LLYASTLCFYVQWFKLDLTFSMLSQLFLTGLIFLGAYTDLIYFLLDVWDSHLNLAVCCCDHCRGCMLKKVWHTTSAGIRIFSFSFGSCFMEPFTNAFVMIFLVIIWDYHMMSLNALLFDYPYKCYSYFIVCIFCSSSPWFGKC